VIEQLNQDVTVTEKGKKTGILQLAMESTSPDSALQRLNEIANIYVRKKC
jgi:tyrosine-protein kinase Etk/Wzc